MKKIILTIIFLIIGILGFSNKGTYDEAKYRRDVVSNALTWIGTPYLWGGNTKNGIDCSHFVFQANKSAGMQGITGKGYVTTSGMIGSGLTKNISYSSLKPGDSILMKGHVMLVTKVLENGKLEVIDAHGRPINKVSIRTINFPPRKYAGVITATATLIANGYTPVNSDGEVVVDSGNVNTENSNTKETPATFTDADYEVSFNDIENSFIEEIFKGFNKLVNPLITLLSLLTVLQIVLLTINYIFSNKIDELINEIIMLSLKYASISYILKNYDKIIKSTYSFFAEIGYLITGNNEVRTLDSFFEISLLEILKILKLINEFKLTIVNILFPVTTYSDPRFYKVIVLIVILFILIYFTTRIIFELLMITISFYSGVTLSFIQLPLFVLRYFSEIGRRPLRTIIGSGINLTIMILLRNILYDIFEKSKFGETTLDTIELQNMFIFIASAIIIHILINKMNQMTYNLNS